jgi:hypothetical protein
VIRRTLAITWPLGVISDDGLLTEAAQVYGDVRMTKWAGNTRRLVIMALRLRSLNYLRVRAKFLLLC